MYLYFSIGNGQSREQALYNCRPIATLSFPIKFYILVYLLTNLQTVGQAEFNECFAGYLRPDVVSDLVRHSHVRHFGRLSNTRRFCPLAGHTCETLGGTSLP